MATEPGSQRKYGLAALVIGAAVARGDGVGFAVAVLVLVLYYLVNVLERRGRL